MEKRIRIIWLLSLLSALLLIGVQVYWLYNQYQYELKAYQEGLSTEIAAACEQEFQLRKDQKKKNFSYMINQSTASYNNDSTQSSQNRLLISIADSIDFDEPLSTDPDTWGNMIKNSIHKMLDSVSHKTPVSITADTLRLSIPLGQSQVNMENELNRTLVNRSTPFDPQRLDSILKTDLPGMAFTIVPWERDGDSTYMGNRWENSGTLLHPEMDYYYTYSAFQGKGVILQTAIPIQPVFKQMGVQLLVSVALILILIFCLLFQIQTIMRQWKLGELRQNFVNTMIHELKRPVQTLKTFISYLSDKEMRADEAATEQVIQDSRFELENLSAYLNKLRDMVRAESDNTPLTLSRFDLRELTEKVIRLTNMPKDKEVEITASYEMDSTIIEADPIHVANILSNLLENAIKYSGDKVQIHINVSRKGKDIWLTVTDNGSGIPFSEQEKVFTKFYRASNIPSKEIPGIGLGLSYVKLIVEAHKGTVSLKSRPGQGTSITLSIPQ